MGGRGRGTPSSLWQQTESGHQRGCWVELQEVLLRAGWLFLFAQAKQPQNKCRVVAILVIIAVRMARNCGSSSAWAAGGSN